MCKQCKPKAGELYYRQLAAVSDLENKFGRAWTQCQRCSGSLHQPVLCTNRDCPVSFFLFFNFIKNLFLCVCFYVY